MSRAFVFQVFEEVKSLPLTLRLLRREIDKNIDLSGEHESLREDHEKVMNKLHELEVENERLCVDNLHLEQMAKSRDAAYERGVRSGKDEMVSALQKVLAMFPEGLKAASDASRDNDIYTELIDDDSDEHNGQWAVYDRICQYGGCDMPSYYSDEMSARIYTATLNVAKIPRVRDICPECRQEYYASMI